MSSVVANYLNSSLMLRVGNRVVLWWYTLIIRMLCGSEAERLQVWGKTSNTDPFRRKEKKRAVEKKERVKKREKERERG